LYNLIHILSIGTKEQSHMGWMLHKLDFRNCTRLLVGGVGQYKWTIRILSVHKNIPNNFGHNLSPSSELSSPKQKHYFAPATLRQNWLFIPGTGFCVWFRYFFYTDFSLSLVGPRKVVGIGSLFFNFEPYVKMWRFSKIFLKQFELWPLFFLIEKKKPHIELMTKVSQNLVWTRF
jgi:hypothetical protein